MNITVVSVVSRLAAVCALTSPLMQGMSFNVSHKVLSNMLGEYSRSMQNQRGKAGPNHPGTNGRGLERKNF